MPKIMQRQAGFYWVQYDGMMRVMYTDGNIDRNHGCGWFDPIYNRGVLLDKELDWIGERLIEPTR